ncbi:N-carbamoyl-L-amino-acid hydrolase [Methylorubrum rhodinum]|uniref:N-carbamoyl-L-amino-acid hydrolase n=1 Tax=Methylorubrum rhodinum TaxID=29428 RepID=A0A840ZGL2_9HYPH|nr:Zn-dependent hydrolase [Methylorubrum rhodinum]MBB5756318.1 N-carbamoyl-L-amino-acid hydrolase [Methylorubrum rhodinum]
MTSTSSRPDADIHALLAAFSACGATAGGGITRLAASPEDGQARDLMRDCLRRLGAEIRIDRVGNLFGLLPLARNPHAPLVMLGSHLDSQTRAGRLDGTYGVAAAILAAETLAREAAAGRPFSADLCVVSWTGEEGARFRPSLLGSGVYAGRRAADDVLALRDEAGITLGAALAAIGYAGADAPPPMPACYLELHVEQGTVLEASGAAIGTVTRNWGAAKLDAVFSGEQAHTGPTPMEDRRDALLGAAYAIADLRALADRFPGRLHSSVGRIEVAPNSANVVPARVAIAAELRSADDALLAEATALAEAAFEAAAARAGVTVAIPSRELRGIRALPGVVSDLVAACAEAEGLACRSLDTVAGHDALSLLDRCPVGLIFVPSLGGLAHNEAEATAPRDLEAGLAVLNRAARRLCRAAGSPEGALRGETA